MIITELQEGQGLGNQLWCYAACRSIADELNVPFKILGYENFKAKDFLDIDCGSTEECSNYEIFHEQRFYDNELDYIASSFDEKVLNIKKDTLIEGLFQSEKYFFDDVDRIKKYITLKDNYKNLVHIPKDVCILNIRGGEYKRHKRFNLPKKYWLNAMENMEREYNISKFMIVTDDQDYAKALFPDIERVPKGIAESYIALHNASYIIVSNSTFSYFPLKTKETKPVVIAPKYFARFNDSLNRWASPANIYKDWIWQDRNGNIYTYFECLEEVRKLENYYTKEFYIATCSEYLREKKISSFIPTDIKKVIKIILAKLFPLRFG
jgi:hypothetical protein